MYFWDSYCMPIFIISIKFYTLLMYFWSGTVMQWARCLNGPNSHNILISLLFYWAFLSHLSLFFSFTLPSPLLPPALLTSSFFLFVVNFSCCKFLSYFIVYVLWVFLVFLYLDWKQTIVYTQKIFFFRKIEDLHRIPLSSEDSY